MDEIERLREVIAKLEAEVARLRGTNLAGAEERLRVLVCEPGLSQPWDAAWEAEGPKLVRSVLLDLDAARASVAKLETVAEAARSLDGNLTVGDGWGVWFRVHGHDVAITLRRALAALDE